MTALTKKEFQARAEANIRDTMDSLPADAVALFDCGAVFSGRPSGRKIKGFAKAGPMVPALDKDFILQGAAAQAAILWALDCDAGGHDALFLAGPAGAGKTALLKNLCARLNFPLFQCTGHGRLDTSDLIGHLTLSEGQGGSSTMSFVDGPLVQAMKQGGLFLLDEADAADPATLILFNGVLDGGSLLIPETGELVHRHPLFRVAFTGNGVGDGNEGGLYVGTQRLNFAFLDRCVTVQCSYPDEAVELGVLKRRVPSLPESVARTCLRYAITVRDAYQNGELEAVLSTRTLVRWCAWAQKLLPLAKADPNAKPLYLALDLALGNRCDRPTKMALTEILQRVVGDGGAPAAEEKKGKTRKTKAS